MTKRFGRTQRRRMRQKVAALEEKTSSQLYQIEFMERQMDGLTSNLLDARREIEEAKEVALAYSAVLKPEELRVSGRPRGNINLPRQDKNPMVFSFDGAIVPEDVMRYMRLPVLLTNLASYNDRLHVRVEFDNKEWGYAITQAAFTHTPRHILVKTIAREIAEAIIRDLK